MQLVGRGVTSLLRGDDVDIREFEQLVAGFKKYCRELEKLAKELDYRPGHHRTILR